METGRSDVNDSAAAERFLKACRREPVDRTPVWLMRQAGRYMKEYRAIREKVPFLTMCKTPDLAAEVTLQPVEHVGVDAAILFADILLPLEPMGLNLEFTKGDGPVIHDPVRTRGDVERLRVFEPDECLSFVPDAIRLVRKELEGKVPLIGFSGAPFTLASYIIEGGGSRSYIRTKSMMYNDVAAWHGLMEKLAEVVLRYLKSQVAAGAQAVQVFDSWVGCLSPEDYSAFVLPHSAHVIRGLAGSGVPVIHFGTNSSTLLELIKEAGGDVIGIDWRIGIDDAWKRLGYQVAVQGNLDPVALFAPPDEIERRVAGILRRAGGRAGHIFNLGHGILPETPFEHVRFLVDAVHRLSGEKAGLIGG